MNNYMKVIINAFKQWVEQALMNKVDVVDGKGLSTEDFTTEYKNKLESLTGGSSSGSGGVQPDWNQNDDFAADYVKNRTHWEENNQTVIEWDGSTEGLEQWDLAILGIMLYKVSDATPTLDELYGCLLGAQLGDDYVELELVGQDYNDVVDLNNEVNPVNCKFIGRFFVVYDTDINFSGQAFTLTSTGIWATPDFRKLVYGTNTVHPLDEKFIPDTIARKSDIVPGGSGGVSSWNDLLDKPSSLPNPKSLTLTGAVNASYDGSEEVVVEIPVVEVPVTSVNGMTGDVTIDIPKIPVTSVNGQTGDVQIDIPESTDSSFVITMTATSWTEQMGADGLSTGVFASAPNCSHTFQEIDDAYKAGKTLIFALMESGDDTKYYLPLLSCGDFNGNTMYKFGIDFGTSFFSGYFLEGNTRPSISRKTYMDKITVNSASVGQTVVVKSVDYKGVPTAWEAVDLYSGSSSQPDWNQNDPYQPDYVKSRTHWIEGSDYVIAELNDAPFAEDGTTDRIDIGDYGHLTVGNKYTVIWDGVEYSQLVAFDDGGYPTIGSPFNNIGSNFPFCIFTEKLAGKISLCVSCANKVPSVHSFTVSEGGKVYHPIDEQFIPDTIARVADLPEMLPNLKELTFTGAVQKSYDGSASVTVEIPTGFSGSWNDLSDGPFTNGTRMFTLEWDGSPTDVTSPTHNKVYKVCDLLSKDMVCVGFTLSDGRTFDISAGNIEVREDTNIVTYRTIDNYSAGNCVYIMYDTPVKIGSTQYVVTPGVYFSGETLDSNTFKYEGHVTEAIFKYTGQVFNDDVIPDTIARVDAPMNSVTLVSPNGTKFCVMIDDSGKLIVSNMDGDVIEQNSGNLPDAEEGEF